MEKLEVLNKKLNEEMAKIEAIVGKEAVDRIFEQVQIPKDEEKQDCQEINDRT